MNAILFVGHGSKDPQGNEEVRFFVESISSQLEVPIVETCFLEFEKPNVWQGLEKCVERGASHIAVIPMMLFAAGHAKIHIPAAIDEIKQKYAHIHFTYGRPIQIHQRVLDILSERLKEIGIDPQKEEEETAILVIGRGSSDPDANSDLFKMSRLFWERLKVKWVETAFMGVTDPLIEEGVQRCLRLGAKHVIILPYFLFTGVLMKRMEGQVAAFRERYPDADFTLAHYFGYHHLLREVFKDRVQETLLGEVKMNCDTCQYRISAMEHMDHHHHHDHEHDHEHDHHHHHHHHGEKDSHPEADQVPSLK